MSRVAAGKQTDLDEWASDLLASGRFIAADLTPAVILHAESLYTIPERGDRLIAATAMNLDLPLITADPAFARVRSLQTIW